ncbi:hypothetical protein [Halorubrum tropicale]|uniref:hypothetical protein n=1 Tax=Halorubrum tropicale TaxID=1765655 RepID=UPI001111DC4C|nr:hypothetical protein [Halorubrum tropicale]
MIASLSPVISGFLSGILGGFGAVVAKHRLERKRKIVQWYARTERLAGRVARLDTADVTGPKAMNSRDTCAGVNSALADHVSQAPSGINDDILHIIDSLILDCRAVKALPRREQKLSRDELKEKLKPAVERAQHLEDEAESARNRHKSWFAVK